jgi:GntR family transcriptional regulator
MQFNPTIPIYLQIMNSIKGDIVTGSLVRGERIESVRTLSEKFGVNLNTMQRACSELEREQVITTQRGVGSFVTENDEVISKLKHEMSSAMVTEFLQGMYRLGFTKPEITEIIRKAVDL